MVIRYRAVALCALLASAGVGETRVLAPGEAPPRRSTRIVLVDEAMHDGLDADGWRSQVERFAPRDDEDDAFRVKVKVRPNRAVGRMSLSF